MKLNAYLVILYALLWIRKRKMGKLQYWLVAQRKVRRKFMSSISTSLLSWEHLALLQRQVP